MNWQIENIGESGKARGRVAHGFASIRPQVDFFGSEFPRTNGAQAANRNPVHAYHVIIASEMAGQRHLTTKSKVERAIPKCTSNQC